uniref:RING-type domain-containing protein n=1 Tax=Araucaria cunninghamii TaxID=56994 RepID=A0A0D6R065_ARACU
MGVQQSKDEMLYNTVQNGNIEAVKALHRSGAGLEWMDKEGRTPLILACTRGDLREMALTLLDLGANLNAYRPGCHGGTPLHHAAKRGHDKTVTMLLHRGANPLVTNDDCETPLQMARAKGHVTVVRIIEEWISLFRGMIRELSGPGFLEALAPQWISKKIWAVVLPSASNNARRLPRFELVIYPSPKVSQPRTIVFLSKVEVEEPKFNLPDPVLVLLDKGTKTRYKFLSETEGDKDQLQRLYEACKGTHQQNIPTTASQNLPLPEDTELAMAINASLQSLSQESIPLSIASQQGTLTSDLSGWASISDDSSSGWGHPERMETPVNNDKFGGWSNKVNSTTTHNGWDADEAGPSSSNVAESAVEEQTHPVSGSSFSENAFTAHSAISAPSAPLLPEDYIPSSNDGRIFYPSIDTSPIEVDLPHTTEHGIQSSTSSSKSQGNSSGTCVICWDAPAEAVCIPCGHLAGCMACLSEIKGKNWGCPVCRATMEQVIKVYAVGLDNPKQ